MNNKTNFYIEIYYMSYWNEWAFFCNGIITDGFKTAKEALKYIYDNMHRYAAKDET